MFDANSQCKRLCFQLPIIVSEQLEYIPPCIPCQFPVLVQLLGTTSISIVVELAIKANHSSLFNSQPGQPGKFWDTLLLLIVVQYPSKLSHKIGASLQLSAGSGKPGGGHCAWIKKGENRHRHRRVTVSALISYKLVLNKYLS